MKIIVLFLCIFLCVSCNKKENNNKNELTVIVDGEINSQEININEETIIINEIFNDFPYVGYVTSRDGLNKRASPSSTSDKLGTLLYGSSVIVYSRSDDMETIDGITDYWYNCQWGGNFWLFGAYLSKEFPSDTEPVIGRWLTNKGNRYYWYFEPDKIVRFGIREAGSGWSGTWELFGNNLIIVTQPQYSSDDIREAVIIQDSQTLDIIVTIINRDNIHLRFSDGNEELLERNYLIY